MDSYEPEKLHAFLKAGGILMLAKDGDNIAGVTVAHILPDPSGKDMLLVFGLDTHPGYRRQGVATAGSIRTANGLLCGSGDVRRGWHIEHWSANRFTPSSTDEQEYASIAAQRGIITYMAGKSSSQPSPVDNFAKAVKYIV